MKRNEYKTKLKAKRIEAGLTQQALADGAGINKRSYERLEQGHRIIDDCSLDTILKVCITLECDIGEVLEDAELYNRYKAILTA